MRKRLGAALAALVIILILFVAAFHNAAARVALGGVGIASGYWVRAGEVRLGTSHGALVDVHVTRGGEPVLDARRIDLDYNPRDLLPGSKHRFGLLAITIDRPHFTLVHHQNGTYNVSLPGAPPASGRPGPPNGVPLDFTVRVRDASATLIDTYRFYQASRRQSVDRINADLRINSATRTWYTVTGYLEDSGAQHFRLAGAIDYTNGYALHHISVQAVPIATIGNYFINSDAAHILTGTVRNLDMRMWAYGVSPSAPAQYHMAGAGQLSGGAIVVRGLDSPIARLAGGITLFDSGFASQRLSAIVGHLPIVCAGGIFNFSSPQFRLGVEGRGNLRDLHEIMRIAKGLPISGGVAVHALVEGNIANPVLMIGFDGTHWNYGAVPLESPNGQVALYKDDLIVLPFHASYGAMKLHIQGTLKLAKQTHSLLALHAIGPSSRIPYLGALVPDQPVVMEALLHGDDLKVDASGYLVSLTDPANVSGFYELDRNGQGSFGPFALRTNGGGSLVAGMSMDRVSGVSTFWASAHNVRMRQPSPIRFPGVSIPELPPMDAQITDANIAGSGSARNVVVGGRIAMAPATIAGVPFDEVSATFAGPFAASRMSAVRADGPWGTFTGSGTFGTSAIAARGKYAGTLEGLHMFLGGLPAHGSVAGDVGVAVAQGNVFIQAQNMRLGGADIQGIPITAMNGTMSFANNILRIYSAQADAAGGTVDVAGTFATGATRTPTALAIVTGALQAKALHGLGVPLSSGTLRAAGTLSPGGSVPDLNAGVVVADGDLLGYSPFRSSAEISITGGSLYLRQTTAALGSTVARVSGTIGGIARSAPSYDIRADVPAGSVGAIAQLARASSYNVEGSFDGALLIGGAGAAPHIAGTVNVPVGSINGLGFRDGRASIAADAGGATVRDARVTVGSTLATFSADVRPQQLAFSLRAPHADLSDFNDYFDTGDTLSGKGSVQVAFSHFNNLTFTSGNVDIDGLRYRRLPIGDTDARWSGVRNIVQGHLAVGGEHGQLLATGTIGFAQSTQVARIVAGSRYDLNAALRNFDLTTWLPALGYPQLPITGRIDADAHIRGAYPHLNLALGASLLNGTLGPLSVQTAELAAQSVPGDRIRITHLVFALPALQADGSGSFGLTPDARMALQLHAVSSDLPRLIAQTTKRRIDLKGRFESTIAIGGTLRAPTFAAGVEGTDVNAYGVAIPSFVGQVQLHRRDLVVRNAEFSFTHGTATIAGALPLQLQPFSFGPPDSAISMDASAQNIDLGTFAEFLGNQTEAGRRTQWPHRHLGNGGQSADLRTDGLERRKLCKRAREHANHRYRGADDLRRHERYAGPPSRPARARDARRLGITLVRRRPAGRTARLRHRYRQPPRATRPRRSSARAPSTRRSRSCGVPVPLEPLKEPSPSARRPCRSRPFCSSAAAPRAVRGPGRRSTWDSIWPSPPGRTCACAAAAPGSSVWISPERVRSGSKERCASPRSRASSTQRAAR